MATARLTDINIPEPNPAVAAAKLSPRMRAIMEERVNTAKMLFQAEVAKDSGDLAAAAHASVEVGGVHNDGWVGSLTVGGVGARGTVTYAGAHVYGRGTHPGSIKNLDGKTIVQKASRDLNRVLEQLGSV